MKSISLLLAALLCSCGQRPPEVSQSADGMAVSSLEEISAAANPAPPSQPAMTARRAAGFQMLTAPSMVIRTGQAQLEVDSVEAAVAIAQALAIRLGGTVSRTSVNTGEDPIRRAEIELRIPEARFDEALGGLSPLGEVESLNVSAQDVGEEFVDVEARLSNARRLEERLLQLLASRTGKLEEVLAVERELARIREEIERFEGRLRYLRSQIAMSTLTLSLHEPFPLVAGTLGEGVIVGALKTAWRNFVGVITAFIASLGVLLPLSFVLWLGWLGYGRSRRARALVPRSDAPT